MADRSTQPLETAIDKGFYKFTEGLNQADVEAIILILKGKQDNNKKDRFILMILETEAQKSAYQDWKKLVGTVVPLIEEDDVQVSLERVNDILGRDFIHNDDLVRLLNKLKDPSTRRAFTQWCEEALGGQGSWPEDYIFDEARRLLSRESSTEPTEEKSLAQVDGFVVVPPQTTTRENSMRQYSNHPHYARQRPLEDEGRPKLPKHGVIGTDPVENNSTKHQSNCQEEEVQKPPQILLKKNEAKPVTEDFSKLRKIVDTLSNHQVMFSKTTVACIKECERIFAQMSDIYLQYTSDPAHPSKNTRKEEIQAASDTDRLLAALQVKQTEQEELKQERWQILDLCAEIRIHIKYKSPTITADSFRIFLVRLIEDEESKQGQGGSFPEIISDLQSVLEYYDRKVMEVGDAIQKKVRNILTEYEIEGKQLDLRRLKHYGKWWIRV